MSRKNIEANTDPEPAPLAAGVGYKVIDKWRIELRELGLKINTDYAITFKYGELRVLCNEVFEATIRETANKYCINIAELFTYGMDTDRRRR
jgi:hypothetical protein